MSRGLIVQKRRGIVGSFPLPPGTRDGTLPRPAVPPESMRADERPDGLAIDVDAGAYARKRWSPSRWNPFRSRWPEVAELDERVYRLEQRQADTLAELVALREQHTEAVRADESALADWVADPEGDRPLPTAPGVEQRVSELERERDALEVATRRVLDEKDRYVQANRRRLRSEAAKARADAAKHLDELIDTVAEAREQVVACVEAERWAAHFPAEDADPASLRLPLVRGGRVSRALPELRTQVAASQVLELLRHDSQWLNGATADAEPDGELDPDKQAIWETSDEGRAALQRKNEQVREGLAPRNVREAGWG